VILLRELYRVSHPRRSFRVNALIHFQLYNFYVELTLIKARFCRSGMRWKRETGATILQLRAIRLSNQWESFWHKVMRYAA
jgi:hypothetical protein